MYAIRSYYAPTLISEADQRQVERIHDHADVGGILTRHPDVRDFDQLECRFVRITSYNVCYTKLLREQLMLITRKGVVNRQNVDEIRVIGRATQGVKLMNLDDGDVVVDVA